MDNYILNDYFDWLYYQVTNKLRKNGKGNSFRKLLMQLHNMEFTFKIENDENRASDGTVLRWYYVDDGGDDGILQWSEHCSVLEMLIALAMKMESIMEEPDIESSVARWFWLFIENLDLLNMNDNKFDKDYIVQRVDMFLERKYESDGNGNIIYIMNCPKDLRKVEIWYQMCWYLDSIIG